MKRHENGKKIKPRKMNSNNNIKKKEVINHQKCEICDELLKDGQESKQHFIQFHEGIVINI